MKRRSAIQSCALMGAMLPFPKGASSQESWLSSFQGRWETAVDYSLKVFDAMPETAYNFQPVTAQKPFAQHFTHMGYWNAFYQGSITGEFPPLEPKEPDAQEARAYFESTCQTFTDFLKQLPENQLGKKAEKGAELWGENTRYWETHTVADFLLRAYMHTTHHRAQAIVYLRLNDITPPFFMF